ncbi:hypothetical protein [Microvirga sesbaniae]|uniref:hypothetical protein n=1 Tax=Microvirga sesbaniae TaxID=681392 RepID=UPI0021C71B44|nr:hypothetical protein [Microvirga sp. HBU67692]
MRYGLYHIEIKPAPAQPAQFDFWIFKGDDPDAIHHGAGYESRAHAHAAAKEWADDHEQRGFK